MSERMLRVGAVVIVATVAGGVLTLAEHRILWGYWRRPSTIVAGMKADRVQAVSQLTESARGELEPAGVAVDLSRLCGPSGLGSCVEGSTLLELFGNDRVPTSISGEINHSLWPPLWRAVRSHNRGATAQGLGTPASGMAVEFSADGRPYMWVIYSTHELEDDWYRTVQLVYALSGSQPVLKRWSSYRYEIAGLEDTPMWLLWTVNAVVLAMAYAVRITGKHAATQRRSGILTFIGSGVLLVVGTAFGLVALSGVHQHDPWLVVFLMTAALMITCGAYIVIHARTHSTPTV